MDDANCCANSVRHFSAQPHLWLQQAVLKAPTPTKESSVTKDKTASLIVTFAIRSRKSWRSDGKIKKRIQQRKLFVSNYFSGRWLVASDDQISEWQYKGAQL